MFYSADPQKTQKSNFVSVLFFQVETELIDKLDILVSENKGDEDYKHLFNAM
jgi:hypothetical protein